MVVLDFFILEIIGFRVKKYYNFFRRISICFDIFNICNGIVDFGIV